MRISFKTFKPNISELISNNEKPHIAVKRLSLLKALKAKKKYKKDFILSSDTLVYARRQIINKTSKIEEAYKNLRQLSGRRHIVFTGLTFINKEDKIYNSVTKTIIKFKVLQENELNRYILTEEWKECAGSYAIQGYAQSFITFLSGSYSNVVGLPMHKFHVIAEKYKLYNS